MKLATFVKANGLPAVGVVDTAKGQILDLAAAAEQVEGWPDPAFRDMLALIDAGKPALSRAAGIAAKWPAAAALPLAGTKLLSPVPEPRQFRDAMVFEAHLINIGNQIEAKGGQRRPIPQVWYDQPLYYKGNRFAFVGHDSTTVWPHYSQVMDYECEMGCVIGKRGKDIKPENALDHVFGFTIFNDLSARDAQAKEMQSVLGPAKGKDFDGANVLGPWIVTTDEIGDPHNLKMEARVNGERRGGGNSSTMHHKWPAIIAQVSMGETIYPGEVIGSGTVGTGCGYEVGKYLESGDVVDLEIEKIGVLRVKVVRG